MDRNAAGNGGTRAGARAPETDDPVEATGPGGAGHRVGAAQDPIQTAMEAERDDTGRDSPSRRVLIKQERLIEAQTAQLGRQRWRDVIITALGACVLAGAALLVWDASRAGGVVVEPFASPPDLVERGLSGPVLAAQVLDRVSAMEAQTESTRAASTYANDWGGEIEIEIPNTDVSIGELRRYLRAWLGDQTRLSGEVFRLADGRLAVAARVGAHPAFQAQGPETDLPALLQQGAEAIYGQTQPYRYSVWLVREGRLEDARAVLTRLSVGKDRAERVWGHHGLGNLAVTLADKERHYSAVQRLRPGFAPATFNLALAAGGYGREERAYGLLQGFLDNRASIRRYIQPEWSEDMLNEADLLTASLVGDMARAANLAEAAIGVSPWSPSQRGAPLWAGQLKASAHDLVAARRILEEGGQSSPEAMAALQAELGPTAEIESGLAAATGDWAGVRDALAGVLVAMAGYDPGIYRVDPSISTRAALAGAYARLGQISEARATIAPTALDCAFCVRARGLVEAYAGNPQGADHWLSQGVRITPSLPTAHADWAEAHLVRRDPARAIAQARLAVRKGPKWAEPRKHWGDALMMQNRPAEAVRQYRDAVRLAPGWGALHLALGRAHAATGRREEARESFLAASRLELNPLDREAVRTLLG